MRSNNIIKELIREFLPYAKQRLGYEKPVRIVLRTDKSNCENPLGKTAFYDPSNMAITLYTMNRHPKDVLRSFSHELVHHKQNCCGQFDDLGEVKEGYAQENDHLREMEKEAYLEGSLCLRDWEDSKKENK